ncbi:MAG: glycosyltransferase family 2 protein [Lachnospiraceae bacterium]|nr:glycosyltransferase family 2 protein [Lachnospiraceae bacterium]
MKATVVIPNYNGLKFLKPCLESLKNQSEQDYATIIIDNASKDGSIEFIKENYPEILLIENQENLGFSKAVNQGIAATKTPYVILLNNDTVVEKDFVKELVSAIEENPSYFSVASKMLSYRERDKVDDAGDMINLFGWSFQRGNAHSETEYSEKKEVFSACAGAAIYRMEILNRIGVFDPLHFAYLEDMDLGFRAKRYGYKNMFCPNAIVYHIGSATSGSSLSEFKVRLTARNQVFLWYKNMPLLQLIWNLPFFIMGCLLQCIMFGRRGFLKAYLSGLLEGIKRTKECKKVHGGIKNFGSIIQIQIDMIKGTWIYVSDKITRK